MYRYFCRRRRLCPVIFLFAMATMLLLLIFDKSIESGIENGPLRDNLLRIFKRGAVVNAKMTSKAAPEVPDDLVKDRAPAEERLPDDHDIDGEDVKQIVKSVRSRNQSLYLQAEEVARRASAREMMPVLANVRGENEVKPAQTHTTAKRNNNRRHFVQSAVGWTPPPNAGEDGKGVAVNDTLLNSEQQRQFYKGWKQHSFNEFASSFISLHRSLPDPRDRGCRDALYRSDLPDTGVVIIFHNEAWSTLLRTIHSVLDRSPQHILRQVILVDDFSSLDHLQKPLEEYVSTLDKVKLVRTNEREGLIRARLFGLSHVTASVVVFLDSHCECTAGWLEPLLDRIAQNSSTVVVPVIDTIDDKTFEFKFQPARATNVGTFSWNMAFHWMPIPERENRRRKRAIDPIRTPTMAGGLFAIDRQFFYKLGTYDPGMRIWGAENLELSFRIWMCGGTLETIPCSHVGHVFRSRAPYNYGDVPNPIRINAGRLAAVWLDEYQIYFKQSRGVHGELDIGDVSERLKLRKQLNCHSFAWYLEHVMPDMFVPGDVIAHGPIYNKFSRSCITTEFHNVVSLKPCTPQTQQKRMLWSMNIGQWSVFQFKDCLDYVSRDSVVTHQLCHGYGGNQLWKYSPEKKQLSHFVSKRCLEVADGLKLVMAVCDVNNPRQRWLWDTSPVPGPSWRKDKAAKKVH